MIHDRRWTAGAAMVLATCTLLLVGSVSGRTQAAATYTQDQASAGQTAYQQACAACQPEHTAGRVRGTGTCRPELPEPLGRKSGP